MIKILFNFVRMSIIITSRSSLKVGHVASKTRSLGQMLEKTRSQGQIVKKPYVLSRGHSFDQTFMKLCQNVNSYEI